MRISDWSSDVCSSDLASIKALMDQTMAHFGSIDILHNNAAYVALGELGEDVDAIETPLDLWDVTMNVNLKGYLLACRYALPHMIAGGGGSVINMSRSEERRVGHECVSTSRSRWSPTH